MKMILRNVKLNYRHWMLHSVWVILLLIAGSSKVHAQSNITQIYTNYGGWWSSGTGSNMNPKRTDDSNILLGFVVNGETYATGVDNALLSDKGVTYHPDAEYEAFPIEKVIVDGGSYVGVPYKWGGIPQLGGGTKTGYYTLPEKAPTYYLTDGTSGLELGTAVFNIKAGFNSEYVIQTINPAEIGAATTPPDIIVTQMGTPGLSDIFKFVDVNGSTVGVEVTVTLGNAPSVGQSLWAFFSPETFLYSNPQPGSNTPENNYRDIRMIVFDLEDFGLTSSNINQVVKFVHVLGGQSDPAFVGAYNKNAFSFVTADLGVEKTVNKSDPVLQNEEVEFTVKVTNYGPDHATNVSVTDKLPDGYTYVSSTPEGGTSYNPTTGQWSIGALNYGDSVTLRIVATVNGTGNLLNKAVIEKGLESDPDILNNTSSAAVVLGGRSIELLKSGVYVDTNGDNTVNVGDHISYTFTVTNTGSVNLTNVIIDDPLLGINALPVSPSTLSPTGTAGSTGTVTRSYALKQSDIDAQKVVNTATVTGKDPSGNDITDTAETETLLPVPDPDYWMGGTPGKENEWNEPANWTNNRVPAMGQDVEFATVDNYGTAAVEDLYLDDLDQDNSGGRIIGNLINNSDKDLVITTGNQLTINGKVEDKTQQSGGSFGTGTIVVKSTHISTNENEPTGTLIINPDENPDGVHAIVEFYNKAYDCADCGFYTRSWQYFGIPVEESGTTPAPLPFTSAEEVNEWSEPTNGNKWIDPVTPLTAFTGYEITRNETTEPDPTNAVHRFEGMLNIGNAAVGLTRTAVVNYSGVNLVGNSYTAAIPISPAALTFPTGVAATVYLFNTGTRDQWRKLNGTDINQDGYRSGQYLAVPVNLGGQNNFPDRIPSMHAFMVLAESGSGGNLGIDYSKLVKNTTVNRGNGEQIVTRSAGNETKAAVESTIPSLVMDVIGKESADRVWIFAKAGTSYGFDNGWDGRKMSESGIAQLYVADDAGEERFQVAAVPGLDNLQLGFEADADGTYTIEFALSDHWTTEEIYLHDLATGTQERVMNGGSYTFEAKKGDSGSRFRLSSSGNGIPGNDESEKVTVNATGDGKIVISNNGSRDCTAFVSDTGGKHLQQLEVRAGDEQVVENITRGIYIVRLQNAVVNDVRRVVVE